jgi:hypothetical protein
MFDNMFQFYEIRSTVLDLPHTGNQKETNVGKLIDAFGRFWCRTQAKRSGLTGLLLLKNGKFVVVRLITSARSSKSKSSIN